MNNPPASRPLGPSVSGAKRAVLPNALHIPHTFIPPFPIQNGGKKPSV